MRDQFFIQLLFIVRNEIDEDDDGDAKSDKIGKMRFQKKIIKSKLRFERAE